MFRKTLITTIGLMFIQLNVYAQWGGPVAVKVADVKEVAMAPVRKIPATVAPKFLSMIKAESKGVVDNIVDMGTHVKLGEVLAELTDSQANLRNQELKNAVNSDLARFEFLQSENVRLLDLMKRNLISNSVLEQNQSDLQSAKSELAQSRSRLRQYQDQVRKLKVLAPFEGYVMQQIAQPGQFLNNGDNVVELMPAKQLELTVHVPIKYREQIIKGAQWQIENQNSETINAQVSRFAPAATGSSYTVKVYLDVPADKLWPGEAVNVLLPTEKHRTVVAVPRDALVIRRNEIYLFTVKDGKSNKVVVTTGMAQGDMIEVNGSLKSGEKVIVRGNERLQPGADLNILP